MKKQLLFIIALCVSVFVSKAQTTTQTKDTTKPYKLNWIGNGRFYGSWGYNTEWYTHSNISVNQPQLNNNYTFENLTAHDRIGWNNLFHVQPTIPQYNYRIGYFFDKKQLWGVEISFDHTKYIVTQGKYTTINGTYKGHHVDSTIYIPNDNSVLYWQLNNGANWFDFNITRKLPIYSSHNKNFVIYGLVKYGVGPNVPHVADWIFGEQNIGHFQLGGWNTAAEALIRFTFFQYAYLEYSNHFVYANYSGLEIYGGSATTNNGTAAQAFGSYEWIVNIGFTFHVKKVAGTDTDK